MSAAVDNKQALSLIESVGKLTARVDELEQQLMYERGRVERQREDDAKTIEQAAELQLRAAQVISHAASRQTSLAFSAALRDLAEDLRRRELVR